MRKEFFNVLGTLLLVVILFSACKDDPPPQETVDQKLYVESFELQPAAPYSAVLVKALLQSTYPDVASMVKYDVKVFSVSYNTVFKGDSIVASGLIYVPVPQQEAEEFPILSFQHGTMASKAEAPSVAYNDQMNMLPGFVACTGMIVAVPDYIGFGVTEQYFHPYLIKEHTTHAVLDMIRATKEFIGIEQPCRRNNKLFLTGYSQGGTATMAALEAIETNPENSDLSVTATTCGGGVYDMNQMVEIVLKNSNFEQPFYVAYITESFSKYTSFDVDYSNIYHADIVDLIPGIVDGVKTGAEINTVMHETAISRLFTSNFINNYFDDPIYTTMRNELDANSITPWDLLSEVKVFHGKEDVWVYSDQPIHLRANFTAAGKSVNRLNINLIDGLDHTGAIAPMMTKSLQWFRSK